MTLTRIGGGGTKWRLLEAVGRDPRPDKGGGTNWRPLEAIFTWIRGGAVIETISPKEARGANERAVIIKSEMAPIPGTPK